MIKNLVKEKYIISTVATINTADLLIERSSMFNTMNRIQSGRISQTKGPLSVFHLTNKDKYLLEDGFHRLFVLLLKHQTRVKVDVIGSGSEINTDLAMPIKPFKIDPNLKYMGLECLADEEILDELANIHKD